MDTFAREKYPSSQKGPRAPPLRVANADNGKVDHLDNFFLSFLKYKRQKSQKKRMRPSARRMGGPGPQIVIQMIHFAAVCFL